MSRGPRGTGWVLSSSSPFLKKRTSNAKLKVFWNFAPSFLKFRAFPTSSTQNFHSYNSPVLKTEFHGIRRRQNETKFCSFSTFISRFRKNFDFVIVILKPVYIVTVFKHFIKQNQKGNQMYLQKRSLGSFV